MSGTLPGLHVPGKRHQRGPPFGIPSRGGPQGQRVNQYPVRPRRISQWLRAPEMFESLARSVWVQ